MVVRSDGAIFGPFTQRQFSYFSFGFRIMEGKCEKI